MVPQVTADEVYDAVQHNKEAVIIDVRTPGEFARGKIQGSINIPVAEVTDRITEIAADKQAMIYLYCLSGSRSDVAAETLAGMGYVNAYSMKQGLLMWRGKKYPLVP